MKCILLLFVLAMTLTAQNRTVIVPNPGEPLSIPTGGTGTVTHTGALCGSAIVVGNGLADLKTPNCSATMDASGNIVTPGTVQSIGFISTASNSGTIYLQGLTSGGVAWAVADVAGTAIAYIEPTTNGVAGQVLQDTGVVACPTLPAGSPGVCHQTAWSSVVTANSPWICKPASASGTAYTCTPTLLDGTAIASSLLAAPVNGQQMIFVPDVANTGSATVTIDGSVAKGLRKGGLTSGSGALASGDMLGNRVLLLELNSTSLWFIVGMPVITSTGGTITVTNPSGANAPNLDIASPLTLSGALTVTGHTTFEGVTSTGATGTGQLVYSISPTFTGSNIHANGGIEINNSEFHVYSGSNRRFEANYNTFVGLSSNNVIAFYNNVNMDAGAADSGISRDSAGVIDVGNGTQGDKSASLKAAGYIASGGTKFTVSGCSAGTTVGGATAGKFTLGAGGPCTVVITMNGATGLTAPNGWNCTASDRSTLTALVDQSADSTTTASINMPVAALNGDVISFACVGY